MKIIKFGFIMIFLAFIKKIHSDGKNINLNIQKIKLLGLEEDDHKIKNTKFLELRNREKINKNILESELQSQNYLENEKKKIRDCISVNLDIGFIQANFEKDKSNKQPNYNFLAEETIL